MNVPKYTGIRRGLYHAMTVPHLLEKTRSGTASMILIHIINLFTKLKYNR